MFKESKERSENMPTVVIIDYAYWPYEHFVKNLTQNGFNVVLPIEDENEKEPDEHTLDEFENNLNKINCKNVFLVIADQFYYLDKKENQEITREWLSKLKRDNGKALIIETSFVPQRNKYDQNNPILSTKNFGEVNHIFNNLTLNNKLTVEELIKNLCYDSFVNAQMFDPNNKPMDYQIKDGFNELIDNGDMDVLYDLIGKGKKSRGEFMDRLLKLRDEVDETNEENNYKQGLVLHTAYIIMFNLQKYNDLSRCSISLTRLSNLLDLSNELSE